jgi:hypothetical protein
MQSPPGNSAAYWFTARCAGAPSVFAGAVAALVGVAGFSAAGFPGGGALHAASPASIAAQAERDNKVRIGTS